ncbi:MAG TPA: hypothetical protein VND64_26430, partial [Pirellulales bacterium]|nr:hypothetical protein [Pirellulales bacterium]
MLVSTVVPAAIVVADSLALADAESRRWSTQATLIVFGLFLVQASLLSYSAGRYLPNWWWRLLVLVWSATVIDLRLYTLSVIVPHGWHGWSIAGALLLVFGFFGSQVSLGIMWAVLGTPSWKWRWPTSALALAPATYFIFRMAFDQYSAQT